MVNEVSLKISNGNKELILTETVSFITKEGLNVVIPVINIVSGEKSELTIRFIFNNEEGKDASIKQTVKDNMLILKIINFNSPLGTGITTPLGFTFGGSQYYILFITKELRNNNNPESSIMTMTFSIYSEITK